MAKLWEIREEYSPEYRHEGMSAELHKAFKEGCKHGYKKAMQELEETEYRGHYPYITYRDEDDMDYRRGGKMGR